MQIIKIGELVMRNDSLVRESLGRGIVIDYHAGTADDTCDYYEVQGMEPRPERPFARAWYGMLELEVISESS